VLVDRGGDWRALGTCMRGGMICRATKASQLDKQKATRQRLSKLVTMTLTLAKPRNDTAHVSSRIVIGMHRKTGVLSFVAIADTVQNGAIFARLCAFLVESGSVVSSTGLLLSTSNRTQIPPFQTTFLLHMQTLGYYKRHMHLVRSLLLGSYPFPHPPFLLFFNKCTQIHTQFSTPPFQTHCHTLSPSSLSNLALLHHHPPNKWRFGCTARRRPGHSAGSRSR